MRRRRYSRLGQADDIELLRDIVAPAPEGEPVIEPAAEPVTAAGATAEPGWWDIVGRFRAAAAALDNAYARVVAVGSYAASRPALAAQYNNLMSRVGTLRRTIASTLGQIDRAVSWFRSFGLGGLGLLPVIGVAVIVAAIAAVAKWTSDAVTFLKAVDEQRRLEAAGVTPERAAAMVRDKQQQSKGSLFGIDLGGAVPLLALGIGAGVAFWLWRRR